MRNIKEIEAAKALLGEMIHSDKFAQLAPNETAQQFVTGIACGLNWVLSEDLMTQAILRLSRELQAKGDGGGKPICQQS